MPAKQITVQAKVNGEVVFDKTIDGKKHQHQLLVECMRYIDIIFPGKSATMRTQTVGANGWGVYSYKAGDKVAHVIPQNEY